MEDRRDSDRRRNERRKVDREKFNTSLDINIINHLQDISEETGIPMNRLIEEAIKEKYPLKKKK
jgi:hypothetical protein